MKAISAALLAHLQGTVLTVATCWRIARRDGTVMGFTDHDQDLVIGDETYEASSGYTRTAISQNNGLTPDNLEIDGLIDSDAITLDDMRAGVYDGAELQVFLVNWADLSMGALRLRTGQLGQLQGQDNRFTAEVRGLADQLQQDFVNVVEPDCRWQFGDSNCRVDLAFVTFTGAVGPGTPEHPISGATFPITVFGNDFNDHFFDGATLTWTSGVNNHSAHEVKLFAGNVAFLYLPMFRVPAPGDTFSIVRGCARTMAACTMYNNTARFGGFNFVPGSDVMYQSPNAL